MYNKINVYIQVVDGYNYVDMDDEFEELEDMLEDIGYENAMISASPEIEII
jgi:outer membrane protein assembly factor BamA